MTRALSAIILAGVLAASFMAAALWIAADYSTVQRVVIATGGET